MPQILVYFSVITYKPQRTLFQSSFDIDIQQVINPDNKIYRYGRTWRFSKPKIHEGFLVGKLGFISSGIEKRTDYDELAKDFIEHTIDSKLSTFVFWAVDLSQQILAFETKPPDIKTTLEKGSLRLVCRRQSLLIGSRK